MTKLPNHEKCVVSEAKITKYLLNLESEHGKSKARFFLAFGFTIEAWQVLADALKRHAAEHEISNILMREEFGANYVVEGVLITPDGRNPEIRVIWAIDKGDDIPRLVSAYPL
jgi:hypothetical protein